MTDLLCSHQVLYIGKILFEKDKKVRRILSTSHTPFSSFFCTPWGSGTWLLCILPPNATIRKQDKIINSKYSIPSFCIFIFNLIFRFLFYLVAEK